MSRRVPPNQRSASPRYYYRRRARRLRAGLTVKGKPRTRVGKWPAKVRAAKQRAYWRSANERLRRRNLAAGLTTNGTPRVNRQFPQLKGLATKNITEYSRRTYLILKAERTRASLAALVTGKDKLITRLK